MRLHKYLLTLLFCILAYGAEAHVSKDLIKKVLAATAAFEQYEIRFERRFKYPMEKDTLSEQYVSTVFRTDMEYHIGWHRISYLRSGAARSLIASNTAGLFRVNYKENLSYSTLLKDNEKLLIQNLNGNVYKPLLYTRAELESFSEGRKTDDFLFLERTDTGKNKLQQVTYIRYTSIAIDRKTYIPVSEETRSLSGTREQYSLYKLLDYRMLEKSAYPAVLKTADSLIACIQTFPSADSIRKSRKDLYRKVKPGDSASVFSAELFNGGRFDLAALKDSVLVLDFFYTTCAPCIAALPELNGLYTKYHAMGLQLFGVNAFDTDWDNVPAYIRNRGVLYPIIKTDKQTVYNFGVTGFPRLFVIKNGIIVKIYYGFAKGMDKELGALIEKLLQTP